MRDLRVCPLCQRQILYRRRVGDKLIPVEPGPPLYARLRFDKDDGPLHVLLFKDGTVARAQLCSEGAPGSMLARKLHTPLCPNWEPPQPRRRRAMSAPRRGRGRKTG